MKPFLLQHLLTAIVSRTPDKTAFRFESREITYHKLDRKSTRLAALLVTQGVKRGDPVGIYLNKSLEAVVSFFAVLKSGGVYIPLDATYSPAERLNGVIALSGAKHLITDGALIEKLSSDPLRNPSMNVILTDTLLTAPGGSDTNPDLKGRPVIYDDGLAPDDVEFPAITDADLAYILYTSGSTGVPKGVMISHRNALTFVNWGVDYFNPASEDVFANHAPLNFDLSVFDIYVSVAAGACACLVPSTIASNPRALARWIADNRITFWYSVPQVWVTLMNYADLESDALPNLKHILFAGEVFQPAYLKKLMTLLPHAAYFNLYGPTETNVCTVYRVPDAGFAGDRPVPIGNACANTEIVVLNDRDDPVAIGEEGELFVRGSGVTPGYYKDSERTRAAFRKSPLGRHHGDMLYGTGDIVLRCDMENFTYVCRKDLMVKCSGFRIELPEVEQALAGYDGIEEAVVVSHGDEVLGTARLHAFFTSKHGTDVSIIRLKKHMLGILPRYMIPDIIERVTEIPRNANGKTDRQAIKEWCT